MREIILTLATKYRNRTGFVPGCNNYWLLAQREGLWTFHINDVKYTSIVFALERSFQPVVI